MTHVEKLLTWDWYQSGERFYLTNAASYLGTTHAVANRVLKDMEGANKIRCTRAKAKTGQIVCTYSKPAPSLLKQRWVNFDDGMRIGHHDATAGAVLRADHG